MATLIKPFRGVPNGEIYPKEYEAGEECPPELEAGAAELGAIEVPKSGNKKQQEPA